MRYCCGEFEQAVKWDCITNGDTGEWLMGREIGRTYHCMKIKFCPFCPAPLPDSFPAEWPVK